MPKALNTSTYRRKILIRKLVEVSVPNMHPCDSCVSNGVPEKCKMGASSERCTECALRNSSECSLTPFSPAKWDRIRRKKVEKQKELRDAFAKITRLQSEVAALEEKELTMVGREVKNIEILEQEEMLNTLDPDAFPFDVSSEQIELPEGLSWPF